MNILFLSVKLNGTAIPIFWKFIEKKGNSQITDWIEILEKFIKCCGKDAIEMVLGDREFVSKEWARYLTIEEIAYCVRIKKNILINKKRAEILFADLKAGESKRLKGKRRVLGIEAYIEGRRNERNELMIVLSNKRENGTEKYRSRWAIEVSFKQMKSGGFNLEATQITDSERLSTLISLISLAMVFSVINGKELSEEISIEIKKHGYQAISLFSLGVSKLREWLLNIENFFEILLRFIDSVSVPSVLYRS